MIRDYQPNDNAVDYGFKMLDKLKVNDIPEWSIIFDVRHSMVYYKTRVNPEIKYFSMNKIDFSNVIGDLVQNMDTTEDADVFNNFQPYSDKIIRNFLESFVLPILPEEFFTSGGLTIEQYLDRFAKHSNAATTQENQYFRGLWMSDYDQAKDNRKIIINLESRKNAVTGTVYNSNSMTDGTMIEHLQLIGNHLKCTYQTKEGILIQMKGLKWLDGVY